MSVSRMIHEKTEDYYLNTHAGRWEIRFSIWKLRIRHELPERFIQWVAFRLPRKLVSWCLVRVASGTLRGNEYPDRHTYPIMFTRWDAGEGA